MSWEIIKLSECCRSIADGDHQPPPKVKSGIPFVTISNINSSNKFDFSNTMYVPIEYYEKLDIKRKAQVGDVLYSVVGSFGIPVLITEDIPFVFQRHIAILRPSEKIDSKFLYYTMLNRDFYMQADVAAIGAAQRTVSLTALRNMQIALPPMGIQKRIVHKLSSYDSLIENNQKQIKLLEEAAQRLYKEWFVDLRFPGYENVEIIDGVPEGWRKDRADVFFDITIGKTPPRAEKQCFLNGTEGIKWLSISDMGKSGMFIFDTAESLTTEAVRKYNMKIVPKGTVFVSFKLTVGRVAIATDNICTNEAIAHFYIKDGNLREYVYLYLKMYPYETLGNTSSISKAVNSKIIKSMPFIMPNEKIIIQFSNKVKPIIDDIFIKQASCENLKDARNRLIPKLMSGNDV